MRELKSEARNSNVNALSTPAVTCVRTPGAAKRHAYGILQCLPSTTASQTERRPSICGNFRQKQPIPQLLKRRDITGFLKFVTQSYYMLSLNAALTSLTADAESPL